MRPVTLIPLVICLAMAGPTLRVDAEAVEGGEASTEADLTWGTGPDVTGRAQRVMAMAVVGRTVFLGGEFTAMVPPGSTWPMPTTTINSTAVSTEPAPAAERPALPAGSRTRNHLAALDVDNGTLLPWNPDADAPVHAMVVSADGTQLYVGGEFDRIGGQPAAKLARIDVATGKVDPTFRPGIDGRVRALALHGNRLYVGGSFGSVDGPAGSVARPKLAALDAASGAVLPWTPPALGPGAFLTNSGVPTPTAPSGDVVAIAVPGDGSRVFVAGSFLDFAGRSGLVVLDSLTGQAAPEQYDIDRPVFDLDVWPVDKEIVFGAAGGSGGHVYAFGVDRPGQPLWSTWVDGDAPGVAASANAVYLMGHYDYAGPHKAERRHLAAFDVGDGAVEPWNPVANTAQGAFSAAVGAGHLFVGGEFTRINGRPQPGFAQFDLAATTGISSTTTGTTATTARIPPRRPSRPDRRGLRPRATRATMNG